ncbi:c-type cytochrome [Paraburkholderia oxyphila]|uniref:c-type cytochrome n=1 Tax=Paraburkholderia oxyphila TaxID=614212 RepID=UPI0007C55D6B|nr:c-type cytochrome [Paraburkholderia oxyphila]
MNRKTSMIAVAFTLHAIHANAAATENCSPTIGEHVFETKCAMCHSVDKTKGTLVGPNLAGVFGRAIGKLPGFAYSSVLAQSTGKWDEKELDVFLKSPSAAKPGTAMPFTGIKNDADRASTICYLQQQR